MKSLRLIFFNLALVLLGILNFINIDGIIKALIVIGIIGTVLICQIISKVIRDMDKLIE